MNSPCRISTVPITWPLWRFTTSNSPLVFSVICSMLLLSLPRRRRMLRDVRARLFDDAVRAVLYSPCTLRWRGEIHGVAQLDACATVAVFDVCHRLYNRAHRG